MDAQLLLEHHRWPTAASLAALSVEESGKVVILRRFVTCTDSDVPILRKAYRTHTQKNLAWIFPELVAKGARTLEDFRPIVDGASDHPELLDSVKQLGLYSDCFADVNWCNPDDVIDEGLARQLVRSAEVLAPDRQISVRELELRAKHMRPVEHQTRMDETALVNWYADMQAEGLPPIGPNPMEAFVRGGLNISQAKKLRANDDVA